MDQIDKILQRPKAYYNVDGTGEMSVGLMSLTFALLLWLLTNTTGSSAWHKSAWFIWMGAMAIIHYGTQAIKQRITYPRTGFVEYPKSGRRTSSLAAAVVAAAAAYGLYFAVRTHQDLSLPVSLMGLPIAAGYALGFARTVPWKWVVFGVLAAGCLVIALLPANLMGLLANGSAVPGAVSARAAAACCLTFMFYGTTLLISGGISFRLYLRHTHPPVQDVQ